MSKPAKKRQPAAKEDAKPRAKSAATKKNGSSKPQQAKRKRLPPSEAARRSMGRLERILLLVPYCVRNPGVSIPELAKRFDASAAEIVDDLNLLFMCGLPDYTPADLIEVMIDEDRVYIRMADYFARPLRLTRSEAIPLYLKAHSLLELLEVSAGGTPALSELGPLRAALEKLGAALLPQEGGVAELANRIAVHLETGEARWLPLLRDAVMSQRRVAVEYYSFSRDAITKRNVDPHLVFATLGHWYMSGWCHLAQDRRMFRLDRMKAVELTDESFEAPTDGSELPPPLLYVPSPEDATVKIRVPADVAVWLSEYLSIETTKSVRGSRKELTFKTSAFPWLENLLLRLGPDVEVIEPAELRDGLKARADAILELYAPRR